MTRVRKSLQEPYKTLQGIANHLDPLTYKKQLSTKGTKKHEQIQIHIEIESFTRWVRR